MKLTEKVQNVGLHDCNCKCYAISKKEAEAAIDLIKAEIIIILSKFIYSDTICEDITALTDEERRNNRRFTLAIKAIEDLK